MSTFSLRLLGMEVPRDCRDECGSKLWTTLLIHLEIDGDQDLGAGLLRKRPNEFAMNWGHKTVLILEFTCAFDSRANRYTLADQHKTDHRIATPLSGIGCRRVSGRVGL